jgi:ribosomal protein S18 acetylase RimI-like enzyme
MSKRGRFGKYGEIKRISRLQKARTTSMHVVGLGTKATKGGTIRKEKKPQRLHVELKRAEASDVEFVRNLSHRVFRQYGPYEQMLPQWFESGITLTLLAFMDRMPVGFAMLSRPIPTWVLPRICELLAIAVDPTKQRLHVADLLLKNLEKTAEKLKVKKMVLHTAKQNFPAQNLFMKHGFVPSEIKKSFYPNGQDALLMYKNLV